MDNAIRTPRKKKVKRAAEPRPRIAAQDSHDAQLGTLSRHLGYALKRAQLRVFEDFIASVAPLKLTPAQFSVLSLLDNNVDRNQSEIAATLGILRPNFVGLLDTLENRGLCSRTRSPIDRRSHVLALTEKGRATLGEAKRLAAKTEAKLAALLTPAERTALHEMLERIARLL